VRFPGLVCASRAWAHSATSLDRVAALLTRSRPLLMLVVLPALVISGCGKAAKQAPSGSSPPPSSTSAAPSSSSASATPSGTEPASLGGRCSTLLPVTAIDDALGRPVIGKASDILGVAEPNIGRLTYLNCRYGIGATVKGKPAPAPQVEIGISLYNSLDQAARRVDGTVQDYRSHGASQQTGAVGPLPATILLGYGAPTIVLVAGPRTVAVSLDAKLAAKAPVSALEALAKAAVDATAGYTGAPGAGASPSDTSSPSDSSSPSPSGS
jgi:hypothetical protein